MSGRDAVRAGGDREAQYLVTAVEVRDAVAGALLLAARQTHRTAHDRFTLSEGTP